LRPVGPALVVQPPGGVLDVAAGCLVGDDGYRVTPGASQDLARLCALDGSRPRLTSEVLVDLLREDLPEGLELLISLDARLQRAASIARSRTRVL